jgi:hypothetical protein
MPSSRKNSASTGHISTQGASVQWLHRITEKSRRVCGNSPFSTCFTQVRLTPTGTWCSDLQAVVQAWQPIHFLLSMINPYRITVAVCQNNLNTQKYEQPFIYLKKRKNILKKFQQSLKIGANQAISKIYSNSIGIA